LDVFAKLFEDGLERRLEAQAFSRGEIGGYDDVLDFLVGYLTGIESDTRVEIDCTLASDETTASFIGAYLIVDSGRVPAPTDVEEIARAYVADALGLAAIKAEAAMQAAIGGVPEPPKSAKSLKAKRNKPADPAPRRAAGAQPTETDQVDTMTALDQEPAKDPAQDEGAPAIEGKSQRPRTKKPLEARTDLGNARRLVRLHGENIRYVPPWKKWLVWDGDGWEDDNTGKVMRLAKQTIESLHKDALLTSSEEKRTAVRRHAMYCQSAPRLKAMIELAQTEIEVVLSPKTFDTDPLMLGVKNGVIDLRTGAFRQAMRENYISRRCNVDFDPAAECPNWKNFLGDVTDGDGESMAFLARAVGYILTGKVNEEVLFVAWGNGSNGKTTFRETIFAMMGSYAVNSDSGLLVSQRDPSAASPDIARLHGRRLVTINETKEGDRLNEGRVKFVTGNDTITARFLHANPFDFMPTHKGFLTTNHCPIITGMDLGIWRRI
jgi:hypothetical protein